MLSKREFHSRSSFPEVIKLETQRPTPGVRIIKRWNMIALTQHDHHSNAWQVSSALWTSIAGEDHDIVRNIHAIFLPSYRWPIIWRMQKWRCHYWSDAWSIKSAARCRCFDQQFWCIRKLSCRRGDWWGRWRLILIWIGGDCRL
jgi:hypothetical protein